MIAALISLAALGAPPESFALVVTNNRSLDPAHADLHYADDDGAQYATLFTETLGREHVTLLTSFDADSRALYPQWAEAAHAPTRKELDAAVIRLATELSQAQARGTSTEVYVVFAGHGDVADGQGYVELADTRLTARELDEAVISRLAADRVHLVLDSCNSYFMLNPRKPGGHRWEAQPADARDLLQRHANLGAVLSTSSEALTYEWSEVQSGIFSYALRSGLRGGADADGDGRVTYAELAAFLETASAPVVNELYRPRVFHAGPGGDDETAFLTRPSGPALVLPATGHRRVTLRDARGVRVLDVHKEDGTPLALGVPQGGLFAEERLDPAPGADRPTIVVRAIEVRDASVALESVPSQPALVAQRGEAPVFESLFSRPFGATAFRAWRERPPALDAPVQTLGISQRDADRLEMHLRTDTVTADDHRRLMGLVFTSVSTVAIAAGFSYANTLNAPDRFQAQLLSGFLGVFTIGPSLLLFAIPTPEHELLDAYLGADRSTREARARAVRVAEERFAVLGESARSGGPLLGAALAVPGVLLTGGIVASLVGGTARPEARSIAPLAITFSLALVAYGAYFAFGPGLDLAREWDLYRDDVDRLAPPANPMLFAVAPENGGATVSVGAGF